MKPAPDKNNKPTNILTPDIVREILIEAGWRETTHNPNKMYHFEKKGENGLTANGYVYNYPEDRNGDGKAYIGVRKGQEPIECFDFAYGRNNIEDVKTVLESKIKRHLGI
ncbi:hypothetical protein J4207_02995 [Candidatus Woesearchaeota archaeon]|nr:hypothetical protein [Candidatus Woesearchaeota archaeon]